ncbi:MAG TPA: flagellar motor switch protein FliM [Ignavibacteriales bacterium]|jgi:flagellar motor switch protein FliM|nr:flagellar motor switch protein FliM [Ignavibacteriales bacterium]HEX3072735.1 flagellar motor switch protein FliM [Ignavibacteriales bacterium]
MAEVLTQQEIDQLLNKIKKGDEKDISHAPDKEVVPFDFRLPNRISKIQLRTIKNIHENFAENLSSFLLNRLQAIVNINVISVDQIYYSEYVLSVSNPACLFTFEIKGTDIKGILEFSTDFTFALIDRLLGGNGAGSKPNQIITPIEQKVLNIIIEKIMQDLKRAWQIIGDYDFAVERFESDIDFAQITSQSESVLLVSFEVYIGDKPYLMNLCFATFAFDAVLSKLSNQTFSTIRPVKYKGTTAKEIITNHLQETKLNLQVEFGSATISMQDLVTMTKGDVIKLNKKVGDELVVKNGDIELFYGHPGVVNKNKAIKITRRAERKESN